MQKRKRRPTTHSFFDDTTASLPDLPAEPDLGKAVGAKRLTWLRPRTGEPEQRFQHYSPESLAKRVRLFCTEHDYSYSHFFQLATVEYLAKHGGRRK